VEAPPESPRETDPRALASLELTQQARLLLEKDRIDDAISLLERAMTLNPTDGKNYYYLAEAWLAKGNSSQAHEFNRLAEMYLEEDPEWAAKTLHQRSRINDSFR
jgi:predicted Zn-dependent protease